MEELKGVKEVNIDKNELVEVKAYKKSNKKLLDKVLLGLGAILLGLVIYCGFHGCHCNVDKEKTGSDTPTPVVSSVTNSTPASVITVNPSGNITVNPEGQGGPTETNVDEGKKACDPDTIESNWETETLPKEDTVTFAYFDAAEEREDELTKADKAYIEEYMDYYGVSYEDARVSYMQFGPLSVPTSSDTYTETPSVEYETRYVFDADDLESINLFVSELGMTRSEAENYYVTQIAPNLGKTIATDIVMLQK